MSSVNNLDFLNLNTLRNYPIKEGKSRISSDGILTIPDDFMADLTLSATSDVTRRFYVSKLSNFLDSITVEVSDNLGTIAGNFSIISASHVPYKEYYFIPTASYTGANGKLVVARLDSLQMLPKGIFPFTISTAEFEPRTIVPSVGTVNRVTFNNFNGSSYTLTGDVKIEARTNVRFKYDAESNSVIIDAGEDLGLNKVCANTTPCIKTINGIEPDEDGNFTLDYTDCITISPLSAGNGLVLEDNCCKPCAGCEDIAALTDRLTALESELLKLRDLYSNLLTTYENFQTAVNTICEC